MTRHYLIASSMRDAMTTASIDYGWLPKPGGRGAVFTNGDGEDVHLVSAPERLRGVRPSSAIYLGHDWWRVSGMKERVLQHRAMGGKTLPEETK